MSTFGSTWKVNDGNDGNCFGEGDEIVSSSLNTGRGGNVYLIDAAIFKNVSKEENAHFQECLDCIEADLLKRILVNSRDLVSVIFYNTQHSPPPSVELTDGENTAVTVVPSNCAVFIPLKPLSKDLIQYFKNFKESDDFFNFGQAYGKSAESCFSEALWLCSRIIIRCNYRLMNSQIVLFTNNELPHLFGSEEQQQAFVRAKDLNEYNISVDLVPLVDEFDLEPFYKEFLCVVDGNMDPEQFYYDKPVDQRFKYLNRINRSNYRKSCLRHINFELADGLSLACDVYSSTRNAKKPTSVKMFRENKEVVLAKRSYYVHECNTEDHLEVVSRKVLTSELYKSQVICGKEILFKPEETIAMKTIENPGMRLLGFKPLEELKPRWMIKHRLFMYPNSEKQIKGSTTLFRALWQKCLDKQKYALCTITLRRFTPPKYVALVPQTADHDGNDGFGIIYLPVETNIGALDSIMKPLPTPTPEQVFLFEKLCKKLRFGFNVQMFCNPSLQSFYSNLEASVYDEEVNNVKDLTLPDLSHQDEKMEPFIDRIDEEFGSEDNAIARKRVNDGETGGTRAKALKSNDVEAAIRNGRMDTVTVEQLKDFIRKRNGQLPPKNLLKKNLFEHAQKLIDQTN